MREFKFRGKRIDNGEWVYGSLMTGKYPSITWYEAIGEVDGVTSYELDCADVLEETVGQYTGLKDKNGTDIYEGDILYYGMYGSQHVVRYNEEIGGFVLSIKNIHMAEIIGNIHENIELLEDTK